MSSKVPVLSILLAMLMLAIEFANGNPIVKHDSLGARLPARGDDGIVARTIPETDLWPWPTPTELPTMTDFGLPLDLSATRDLNTIIWQTPAEIPTMTDFGLPIDPSTVSWAANKPAEIPSQPTPADFKIDKRDTTPPKTTRAPGYPTPTTTSIKKNTKSTKCAVTLYRPTPYAYGPTKTKYSSTRHLTSYFPCGSCTIVRSNPFTDQHPVTYTTTVTVDRVWDSIIDKCETTPRVYPWTPATESPKLPKPSKPSKTTASTHS